MQKDTEILLAVAPPQWPTWYRTLGGVQRDLETELKRAPNRRQTLESAVFNPWTHLLPTKGQDAVPACVHRGDRREVRRHAVQSLNG